VIPKIDSDIGILLYSTHSEGCGGKIRVQNEDFLVSEILSEKSKSQISEKPGYAVYLLKKQNIDTNHALNKIFKKTGIRLKSLGLKDASAQTEQYVCSATKSRSIQTFDDKKYSLSRVGFVQRPLSKKDMVGNNFKIKITGASSKLNEFSEFDKILNFFGYQRFGSKRPVTHLIGKAIVQKNFQKAVELSLSFTSSYDLAENNKIRNMLSDKSNYSKIINEIPIGMDLECILVEEMIAHDDPLGAIRKLPLYIRRFYVQAYQSFLFNKTLGISFEQGENLFRPQDGDVCYDKNGIIGKYVNDAGQKLAIPLVGYSYFKKTRFDRYISEILKDEEVTPKDFFLKELQEASNEGGFRNSSINCLNPLISGNSIEFTTSRGSFATMVLREIMKPADPILAGF